MFALNTRTQQALTSGIWVTRFFGWFYMMVSRFAGPGMTIAVAYLILYTLALFIYDQATIELPVLQSRWLPAMVAAVVAAAVGCMLPARWSERLWPGWVWVVPVGALAVLGYYLSPYFTR